MAHLDPYAYAFHDDPYPVYAALRSQAPVYRNDALDFFALSRHADVLAGFKDSARFSSGSGVSLDPASWGPAAQVAMSFLAMDPPQHTRMRALVSRGFTPRRVAALEPRIRQIAVAHLDACAGRDRIDVVDDLAGKLPMDVVSEMLGVPAADRAELRRSADLLVHREEGRRDVPKEGVLAFAAIRAYFTDLIEDRRRRPGDDLLSALLGADLDGDRLGDADILSFCNLMIVAGNETTTKLIANALYWLWRHPDQRALVRADPRLVPGWIEETLRYDNSSQILARVLTREVSVRGVRMPKGSRVLLLVGSANRDEEMFAQPDAYDIRRDTSEMLSFGRGAHFCMGAALARLEACVALEEWWRRHPDYEVDPDGAVRVHSVNVRGFAHLPVKV
jgi:hypothetical protein